MPCRSYPLSRRLSRTWSRRPESRLGAHGAHRLIDPRFQLLGRHIAVAILDQLHELIENTLARSLDELRHVVFFMP